MDNPYSPPAAVVTDVDAPPRSSWLRTSLTLIVLVPTSQVVAWMLVPILAFNIANTLHKPAAYGDNLMLLCDLLLSFLVISGSTFLGVRIAKGRAFSVGLVMGLIGWLLWFGETVRLGAPSSLPDWYQFFPSNIGAAFLGAYLASRRSVRADQGGVVGEP